MVDIVSISGVRRLNDRLSLDLLRSRMWVGGFVSCCVMKYQL